MQKLNNRSVNLLVLNENDVVEILTKEQLDKHQKYLNSYMMQTKSLRDVCLFSLEMTNNKSLSLYLMLMCVELYIKTCFVSTLRLIQENYSICFENIHFFGDSPFKMSQLGHDLIKIFNALDSEDLEPVFFPLRPLRKIYDYINRYEEIKWDTVLKEFPSLRYNCDKSGHIIFENNNVDEKFKKYVKEVLSRVRFNETI